MEQETQAPEPIKGQVDILAVVRALQTTISDLILEMAIKDQIIAQYREGEGLE